MLCSSLVRTRTDKSQLPPAVCAASKVVQPGSVAQPSTIKTHASARTIRPPLSRSPLPRSIVAPNPTDFNAPLWHRLQPVLLHLLSVSVKGLCRGRTSVRPLSFSCFFFFLLFLAFAFSHARCPRFVSQNLGLFFSPSNFLSSRTRSRFFANGVRDLLSVPPPRFCASSPEPPLAS